MIARPLASLAVLLFAFAAGAEEASISKQFPEQADPAARYVVYNHGAVAEGAKLPRPLSPHFGAYHMPELEQALADPDWHLIVPPRPRDAPAGAYGARVASEVQKLIDEGVAPEHIALIGFSKGGQIVSVASSRLRPNAVRVVLIAACWPWVEKAPNIVIGGPMLSLRDASDPANSCRSLAEHGDGAPSFEEIITNVGDMHGSFFKPHDEWVDPLRAWLKEQLGLDAAP